MVSQRDLTEAYVHEGIPLQPQGLQFNAAEMIYGQWLYITELSLKWQHPIALRHAASSTLTAAPSATWY